MENWLCRFSVNFWIFGNIVENFSKLLNRKIMCDPSCSNKATK